MVRLKLNSNGELQDVSRLSQFHYGSIKTFYFTGNLHIDSRSQFHYGSIKTVEQHIRGVIKETSQFHYGSIKTPQ